MSEEKMNLYQKLVEVRKTVPYLQKTTEGYKYKYVAGADVLAPIVTKMNELGLLLIPEILEYKTTYERYKDFNDKGKEITVENRIVEAKMNMKWINADKPDEILIVPFLLFGEQNDISKAFGSALTYSERYFLLKFFNISTDEDDPDTRQGKKNDKEKEKTKKEPSELDGLEKEILKLAGDNKNQYIIAINKHKKAGDWTVEKAKEVIETLKTGGKSKPKRTTEDILFIQKCQEYKKQNEMNYYKILKSVGKYEHCTDIEIDKREYFLNNLQQFINAED